MLGPGEKFLVLLKETRIAFLRESGRSVHPWRWRGVNRAQPGEGTREYLMDTLQVGFRSSIAIEPSPADKRKLPAGA